jgi:hypothetical protein
MSEFFERPPAADQTLIGRMIRAARLDPRLYTEIQSDPAATGQAASVVMLAALAGAINLPGAPFAFLFLGLVAALFGWWLFSYAIYWVGAKLLPESGTKANFVGVLRAVGFANAPGVLKLMGIVPELRVFVLFVATVWVLVATVTAVRCVLSYQSSWRAIGVCAIPLLVSQLLLFAMLPTIADSPELHQGMVDPAVILP